MEIPSCVAHGACSMVNTSLIEYRSLPGGYVSHPETLLCVLGRVEVDYSGAKGIHVDPYGDECGELFFEKSGMVGWNLCM